MKHTVSFRVSPAATSKVDGGVGILTVAPFAPQPQAIQQSYIGASAIRLGGQSMPVDLDPGRYVASVRVPNGQVYSRSFELNEADGFEVTFGEEETVLAEQQTAFIPTVRGAAVADSDVGPSYVAKSPHALPQEAAPQLMQYVALPDTSGVSAALSTLRTAPPVRSNLPRGWSRDEVLSVLGTPEGQAASRRVESSPQRVSIEVSAPRPNEWGRIRYALMLGQGQSFVARLPGRWQCVSTGKPAVTTIDATRQEDARYKLDVRISDPDMQSVLGFILQSDLEGALAVLDACKEILSDKAKNPYAAAAAGYVLLNAPATRSNESWHRWIGNLGRFFPNLPDGLILHATLLLQSQAGQMQPSNYFPGDAKSRANMATELLLGALERGLPLYRAGVRLLASNLRILVSEESAADRHLVQVRKAHELSAWMLTRLDAQQVFTVVDFSDL